MAAIYRPTEATYVIHDRVTVETTDNEDHTFCGIMFPVKCKDLLPLNHVVINSVAVRGRLGPLTVWVSQEEERPSSSSSAERHFRMNPRFWTKIYEMTHNPSYHTFCTLDLKDNPIVLKPGQVRAVYIHSSLHGDESIVYDNLHKRRTYDDALVSVLTGRAHVSDRPFGTVPVWGWGNPWRDQREFVGRIEYGAVYKLWNPSTRDRFGSKFQNLVRSLFLCQRRWESPFSKLPDDCIFYILNMCRWDWAEDTPKEMKELRKRRQATAAAAAAANTNNQTATPNRDTTTSDNNNNNNNASSSCCNRRCGENDSNMDEEVEDDPESVSLEEEEEGWDLDDDDDDDDDRWTADSSVFRYRDAESDDEQEEQHDFVASRRAWIRRQFARIHVLQALAALEDGGGTVELGF